MPLVADIHFQPTVAMMVAEAFEKIRVNPGNFADGRKTFEVINYDDPAQFAAEQETIREVGAAAAHPCFWNSAALVHSRGHYIASISSAQVTLAFLVFSKHARPKYSKLCMRAASGGRRMSGISCELHI